MINELFNLSPAARLEISRHNDYIIVFISSDKIGCNNSRRFRTTENVTSEQILQVVRDHIDLIKHGLDK